MKSRPSLYSILPWTIVFGMLLYCSAMALLGRLRVSEIYFRVVSVDCFPSSNDDEIAEWLESQPDVCRVTVVRDELKYRLSFTWIYARRVSDPPFPQWSIENTLHGLGYIDDERYPDD